jgi:hypothetical protein
VCFQRLQAALGELVAGHAVTLDSDGRMSTRDPTLLVTMVSPKAMTWMIERVAQLAKQTPLENAKEQVRM